eukprot:TRINITY_DN2160_c0_g1_i1.p1 TRINITY_DN2160_c0_g1~~TRINITY_DN2160_c0_g1_i1.p1  ORF type:complete len:345 (+),score=89.97 TRINITY_DN2160_c0_g1_i1:80-1114(+)
MASSLEQLSTNQLQIFGEIPPLRIIRQTYFGLEKRSDSKNGVVKSIHMVVKKQPFFIEVGNNPGSLPIDFNHMPLETKLHYDSNELNPVPFIKVKPMEIKSVLNDDGTVVTFEVRLHVLSSQMEDMNFRISFTPIDPETKDRLDSLVIFSEPIRVVSKPEQARRGNQTAHNIDVIAPNGQQSGLRRKRAQSQPSVVQDDSLASSLTRLESQVKIQQEMIAKLCESTQLNQQHNITLLKELSKQSSQKTETKQQLDLESAFQAFFEAYNQVSVEERPVKLRRIITSSLQKKPTEITEMISNLNTESGFNDHNNPTHYNNQCGLGCPHKIELDSMDNFFTVMSDFE